MNRLIKFRSWNGYEMREMKTFFLDMKYKPEIKIMQFTGLKDRNGKEIYEKDVLKIIAQGVSPNHKEIVRWEDDSNSVFSDNGWRVGSIGWKQHEIEVIGNIYENPELLKT